MVKHLLAHVASISYLPEWHVVLSKYDSSTNLGLEASVVRLCGIPFCQVVQTCTLAGMYCIFGTHHSWIVLDSGLKADVLATIVLSPSIKLKSKRPYTKGQDGLNTISGAASIYTAILMGSFSFTACWFFFACSTLHTARKKNTKFICDKNMESYNYAAMHTCKHHL